MKLLGSTKIKATKNENSESMHPLEISELVLLIGMLLTTIVSKIQEYCIHLFQINHLSITRNFTKKNYFFKNFQLRILIYGSMVY